METINASPLLLTKPCKEFLESYRNACSETCGFVNHPTLMHDPAQFDEWKDSIFETYEKHEKGIDLPEGQMPSATFWLVSGSEYIGTINIRLKLNKELENYGGHASIFIRCSARGKGYASKALELTLEQARKLGISPILITCIESNAASLHSLLNAPHEKRESVNTMANGTECKVSRFWFR